MVYHDDDGTLDKSPLDRAVAGTTLSALYENARNLRTRADAYASLEDGEIGTMQDYDSGARAAEYAYVGAAYDATGVIDADWHFSHLGVQDDDMTYSPAEFLAILTDALR